MRDLTKKIIDIINDRCRQKCSHCPKGYNGTESCAYYKHLKNAAQRILKEVNLDNNDNPL